MLKTIVIVVVLPFLVTTAVAQTMTGRITGRDLDGSSAPLEGVRLLWKSTTLGALTRADGTFSIARPTTTDTLLISAIGYRDTMIVQPADGIIIILEPLTSETDVVDVVGDQPTISRATQKTEVITRKDLMKAACCSLAESFEKNPSVEVTFSDAVTGARQIQLLGLRGTYTQMLTEAVPMIRSMELPFGLEHVPGPFLGEISIAKGPATVTNGHEAMTGMINLCFHDPRTSPRLFVNAYGNTMSRMELNIYGAQQVTDELSTMTYLHGRRLPHAPDNNNDGFDDLSTFDQINAAHRWFYSDDEIEWQVFVRGFLDSYSGGQRSNDHSQHGVSLFRITNDIKRLEGFVKLGLLDVFSDLGEGSSISLVIGASGHEQQTKIGSRDLFGKQTTVNSRLVSAIPLGEDVKLVAGFSYMFDDVNEGVDTVRYIRQEHEGGAFAELTIEPIPLVTVVAGLRVDAHNLYGTRVVPRIHTKWTATESTNIRLSAGRGWRVPAMIVENMSAFVNARSIVMDSVVRPEDSWNYGISITQYLEFYERPFTFDVEVYRTEFQRQVVVDYDASVRDVRISNLSDGGFSTSVMAQLLFSPVERLQLQVAWRYVDVQSLYDGQFRQRPMFSPHRVLTTASYATVGEEWQFDLTVSWNGSGRLPSTAANPEQYRRGETFPSFWRVNGQITKRFGEIDLYVGTENLFDFIQQDPVIAADAPTGPFFDGSLSWGPLDSRIVYVGIRYTLE
ncbi:MAG TPA: TonB-dependent receptor [Chlorobiota bacterium]|nr:TonB-dependent receptor [Chlorobiota bacterium]